MNSETGWNKSSVSRILTVQEYCGDVINFKTYTKSFKHKKRLANSEENMAVFLDVHDPIIERATFEKVKAKRGKRRKSPKTGEKSIFSGLLVCGDCGGTLHYHFNQSNNSIKYFNCPNNNKVRKTCDKTHYIRVDFLEQVVLQEIRRLTKFASRYEKQFAELVMGHSQKESEIDQRLKRKELDKCISRDKELDKLFNIFMRITVLARFQTSDSRKCSVNMRMSNRKSLSKSSHCKRL